MGIGKFEKEYPMLFDLIKEMEVCHGAYNKDWLFEVEGFEVLERWKAKFKEGEELIEKYNGVTFGDVWKDMPQDLETISPDSEIIDYSVFPENGDWSNFLEHNSEFKLLDNILFEAFEGVLDGLLKLRIPEDASPQKEQERILKATGLWKGESDESDKV